MQNVIDAIVPIIIFIAVISGIVSSIRESIAKNSKAKSVPNKDRHSLSLSDVPRVYVHQRCGVATVMPDEVIRNYLNDPHFYKTNTTFCARCQTQVPLRECRWQETGEDLQTYTDQLRAGRGSPQSRVQSEIAAFLSGQPASAANVKQRPAGQQRPAATSSPEPQKGNRPRQKPKNTTVSNQPAKNSQQPRAVGSGVSAHVDSFIKSHVDSYIGNQVSDFVKKDITERVKSDLGSQSRKPVEISTSDTRSQVAENLLSSLRSRTGVRHAILVNEILSKPVALRKK